MLTRNPAIWSIWPELGIVAKLSLFIPVLVGIYIFASSIFIMVNLWSLAKSRQSGNSEALIRAVSRLTTKSNNLRNLLGATFYVFGFMLFASFPNAFFIIDNSNIPIGTLILHNLNAQFALASNVFFIFFALHCIQWFVSSRIRAFDLRLKTLS
jgi:hypothetical protein